MSLQANRYNESPDTDVVIIGGGCAGLASAVALSDAGLRVTLVEREAVPGGRVRSIEDETTGDVLDTGPHILLSGYRNMLQLLERLGTHGRIAWHRDEFITLVDGERVERLHMRALPASLLYLPGLLRSRSISLQDLLSNRRVMWLAMNLEQRDIDQLDRSNAYDMLVRLGVSSNFIKRYWRSVVMMIMNVPLEQCSGGTLMNLFRLMAGQRGCRIGFPATRLADLVIHPAIRAIEHAGGRVLSLCEVVAIEGKHYAFSGVRLKDGTHIRARACIAALPPHELPELLPEHWRSRYSLFRNVTAFQPCPYIGIHLWFSRKLTHELFWARAWSPAGLNHHFHDLSNIRAGWGNRPSLIAGNVIASERVIGMTDDQIIDATLEELKSFLPGARRANVLHARVHRIPMAIPAPLPGSERLRPQTRTPVGGLFLAGDWIGTGLPASMESAICAGNRAAERASEFLGDRIHVALPIQKMEGVAGTVRRWIHR